MSIVQLTYSNYTPVHCLRLQVKLNDEIEIDTDQFLHNYLS